MLFKFLVVIVRATARGDYAMKRCVECQELRVWHSKEKGWGKYLSIYFVVLVVLFVFCFSLTRKSSDRNYV